MNRFIFIILIFFWIACIHGQRDEIGEKIVVLTFDDAVKSHLTVVAPLLREFDFKATFFISHAFMEDTVNFLTWKEVGELHRMGFEIGNHSWTHPDFSQPVNAAEMAGELGLIEWQLMSEGIPKPVSFAWTGNGFGPEAIRILEEQGIQYARRGMQPEVPYGSIETGPVFQPEKHHRLLIPTTRDAYPDMKFRDFKKAVKQASRGRIVVLQFHGVPDPVHPWVHTEPEMLKKCLSYLHENNYTVIAMKNLESFLPEVPPEDSLLHYRHVLGDPENLRWPAEVKASREEKEYWIRNMKRHNYDPREMAAVFDWTDEKMKETIEKLSIEPFLEDPDRITVLPYPGGRHPRIDFKEGMLSPMRGTKATVFLPWDPGDYLVLDLPEAIFTQYGLTFLGHKHIPTVFDLQKIKIMNRDWIKHPWGRLSNTWELPNKLVIGAEIIPGRTEVDLSLWLYNGTADTTFSDLQTQICIMFKGAGDFNQLTNKNKKFEDPIAAVKAGEGDQWILTAWERCNHTWGNENCPCMHSDPAFPDCAPGDTVRVSGKIWFAEDENIKLEMEKASRLFMHLD